MHNQSVEMEDVDVAQLFLSARSAQSRSKEVCRPRLPFRVNHEFVVDKGGNPIDALSLLKERNLGRFASDVDPGAFDHIFVVTARSATAPADGTTPSNVVAEKKAFYDLVLGSVDGEQA